MTNQYSKTAPKPAVSLGEYVDPILPLAEYVNPILPESNTSTTSQIPTSNIDFNLISTNNNNNNSQNSSSNTNTNTNTNSQI